jgi:hypothetical protein
MWPGPRRALLKVVCLLPLSLVRARPAPNCNDRLLSTHMWRPIQEEGCERGELAAAPNSNCLRGTIVRMAANDPVEVRYEIACDAQWSTRSAQINCRDRRGERNLRFERQGVRWYANEMALPHLSDCIDVDLAWSPSTHTLPIRRLNLAVGTTTGPLTMAWIRFPGLTIEPLRQTYERLSERNYRYISHGGAFVAGITVDEYGLVVNYESAWQRVGRSCSTLCNSRLRLRRRRERAARPNPFAPTTPPLRPCWPTAPRTIASPRPVSSRTTRAGCLPR